MTTTISDTIAKRLVALKPKHATLRNLATLVASENPGWDFPSAAEHTGPHGSTIGILRTGHVCPACYPNLYSKRTATHRSDR